MNVSTLIPESARRDRVIAGRECIRGPEAHCLVRWRPASVRRVAGSERALGVVARAKKPEVIDPRGRLDIAARDAAEVGIRALGNYFGAPNLWDALREPVERFIQAHVPSEPIPTRPIEIAERLKLVPTEKQLLARERRRKRVRR